MVNPATERIDRLSGGADLNARNVISWSGTDGGTPNGHGGCDNSHRR